MADDDTYIVAGELALGLLEGAERREAQARVDRDPAVRHALAFWQTRLVTLMDTEAPEIAPPRHLRAAIRRDLFGPRGVADLRHSLFAPRNRGRVAFVIGVKLALITLIVLLLI